MESTPRPARSWILALLLLLLVAWVDWKSGYEVSVFVLYAFPIAYAAWTLGRVPGLIVAILSTAAWRWADLAAGHVYTRPWIGWEKAGTGFVLFAFIAFSFDVFHRTQERDRQRLRDLETILPICTVCHRIRNEKGEWVDFEAHLRAHVAANPRRPTCVDCAGAKYMTDNTL